MTIEEFNHTGWSGGMTARYHGDGNIYPIASCDFGEQLIGLKGMVENEPEEVSWVRCENCTIECNGHKPAHRFVKN